MGGCAGPSDRSSASAVPGSALIVALAAGAAPAARPRTTRCSSRGSSGASSASAHPGRGPRAPARASRSRWSTPGVDLAHEDLAPQLAGPHQLHRRRRRRRRVHGVGPGRQRARHPRGRHRARRPPTTAAGSPAWRPTPASSAVRVLENSCDDGDALHGHRVRRRRGRRDPLGRRPRRRRHQPQPRRRHAAGRARLRVLRRRRVRVVEGRDRRDRGRQRLRAARRASPTSTRWSSPPPRGRRPGVLQQRQLRAARRRSLAGGGARRRGGDRSRRLRDRRHAEGHPVDLLGRRASTNGYACLAGTSMAAPHVSGRAGGAPQHRPRARRPSIDRLLATAQDLGAPGPDDEFGVGRIDLGRAVGTAPGGTSTTSTRARHQHHRLDRRRPAASAVHHRCRATTTTTAPPVSLPRGRPRRPRSTRRRRRPTSDDCRRGSSCWRSVAILASGGGVGGHGPARWRARHRRASRPARAYGGAPPPAP